MCGVTCDTTADTRVTALLALDFVRVQNELNVAVFCLHFGNFEFMSYLLQK